MWGSLVVLLGKLQIKSEREKETGTDDEGKETDKVDVIVLQFPRGHFFSPWRGHLELSHIQVNQKDRPDETIVVQVSALPKITKK